MKARKKGIIILGSTGSIGKSSLAVIRENPDRFYVEGLSCVSSLEVLAAQIIEFSPKIVAIGDGKTRELQKLLTTLQNPPQILEGKSGAVDIAAYGESEILIAAIVGAAGIEPVIAGIRAGKNIALANKESMVLAGALMIHEAHQHGVKILPVDSEHNAIFQSLQGNRREDLSSITLTASGGPFRQKPLAEFKQITLEDALNHPNWDMGPKITIDSATMMNKALEVIEAKWLFDVDPDQINVLVHPQSIVHSMVTYKDGSTIAQMGVPDMRTPIASCLGYPERIQSGSAALDLAAIHTLTFEKPDFSKFPTIKMAYRALRLGGCAPAALNGANEVLVEQFLGERISFMDIMNHLQRLMETLETATKDQGREEHPALKEVRSISDAIDGDAWGRDFIHSQLELR